VPPFACAAHARRCRALRPAPLARAALPRAGRRRALRPAPLARAGHHEEDEGLGLFDFFEGTARGTRGGSPLFWSRGEQDVDAGNRTRDVVAE